MQCHYCTEEATHPVEWSGVTVWLCDQHLKERMEELGTDDWLSTLREELS